VLECQTSDLTADWLRHFHCDNRIAWKLQQENFTIGDNSLGFTLPKLLKPLDGLLLTLQGIV